MTVRIINRPTILAALILAAAIALTAIATPGAASNDQPDHLPGYPYATLSSASR